MNRSTSKEYFDDHWTRKASDHPVIEKAISNAYKQYEKLFYENGELITFSSENLHMENELLKFVKLMEYQGQNEQKLVKLFVFMKPPRNQDSLVKKNARCFMFLTKHGTEWKLPL